MFCLSRSSSLFASASSSLPLAAGARLAGYKCVCPCMCETVHILGQETVGKWSPLRLLDPGGKGSSERFGTRWKFLTAFFVLT